MAPSANVVDTAVLARATSIINESIRHHKLSTKEIIFLRSQVTSENLDIKDKDIANNIKEFRDGNK